jgi:PAS domain S-box-containing protein
MEQNGENIVVFKKDRFLSGGGEMERLISLFDWRKTSVGPKELWPQSFRTALNICLNSKNPSLLLWKKEMVCFYNETCADLIGKNHPALLGSNGGDVCEEVWGKVGRSLEEAYNTGMSGSIEDQIFILNRQGYEEECCFSLDFSPVFNEQGDVGGVFLNIKETTGQKAIIRKLEESQRKFKTVADTAPAMIWTSGKDQLFDFFNKGWLDFTGKDLEEELGNGWIRGIQEDDKERYFNVYNSSFVNQKKFSIEYRMKRHDGKYRWISDEGTPRYSFDGEFLGYIGARVDIQERKMAKEELERKVLERTSELNKRNNELQQQKEFVDTILESSVDIIAVFDKQLKYVALNKSACNIYKVDKEKLMGKKILDVFPQIKISGMYDDLQEALTGKTIHNPKYKSTIVDKHFENFYIPLKNRNEEVYGVLLVSHDNTAIIEAKEKLEQTNRVLEEKNLALERSNRELESFSYVASHDLQEPLRKIRTFAGLVQRNLDDEKAVKRYFAKIDSSAQRMGDLIKAVLNYSRLSRKEDLYASTDLNNILRNVRSDFELLIQEKGAAIKNNKLPVIKGIPLQLNQLFSNLIGNSIKFSVNKPTITITSKLIEAENMPLHSHIQKNKMYAELIFKDNGIGFEQQYSDQIFTIFKRLHGSHTYAGTGIGLALCKKIVENHKGFIAVQSEPGKGSEFYVYLPVD